MKIIGKWRMIKGVAIFVAVALIVLFLIYMKFRVTGQVSLEIEAGEEGIVNGFWNFLKGLIL